MPGHVLGWPLFCPQNCPLRVWASDSQNGIRIGSATFAGLIVVTRQIIIMFVWHNQAQKCVPNCDVSFANGELQQAYGHVTLTNAWLKYGHRSLVGCMLPRLCSCSWPPWVCKLIPWVVLFSDGFLYLGSWRQTTQWHDSLLPRDPLWLTFWLLLTNLFDLPVSMFCCW